MNMVLALSGFCMFSHAAIGQSVDDRISRADAVIRARFANILRYTVTEHYAVYRNGASTPSAERTVQATYEKSKGTHYMTISQSGASIWQSEVIEPSLASDQHINDPTTRQQLMLTTDNYEFRVEPATMPVRGQDCFQLNVKARKPSAYLINGNAWVNAETYRLVRVQGTQSKSLSLWAGTPLITRDFIDVNGFAMVTQERIEAHTVLVGRTVEEIDYRDYKVAGEADTLAK
jgi:hypothetical protein